MKHYVDEGLPGYSQTRLLLFLAEHGPEEIGVARWRSRASAGTWQGTIRWCRSHSWIDMPPGGLCAITAAGLEALERRSHWFEEIRREFRPE